MAEPAQALPPENKPQIRPQLGVVQSGGDGDGVPRGDLRSAEESSRVQNERDISQPEEKSTSKPTLKGLEGGSEGDGQPKGSLRSVGSQNDSADESDDDDSEGGRFTADGKTKSRFRINKRVAAGAGSLMILAGVIGGGSSILQGPLEIVHFAKLLEKFHMLGQEDAQDNRLTKIVRYLREPTKPQNTRLGYVGNKIADRYAKTMKAKTGLEPVYDKTTGKFLGYEIDRTYPDYENLKTNQLKDKVGSKFGGSSKDVYVAGNTSDGRQRLVLDPERNIRSIRNPIKAYRAQVKAIRSILVAAGYSKKSAYVGARVLSARANLTFHPIRRLDAEIQASTIKAGKTGIDKLKQKYKEQRIKYITTGSSPFSASGEDRTSRNQDGNPTDPNNTDRAQQAAGEVDGAVADGQEAASKYAKGEDGSKTLSDKLKARAGSGAGKAVGVLGLACLAQAINDQVKSARYVKAMLPMMRMAGDLITTGSQIMSGNDITMLQAGLLKDSLTEKDKNGRIISTWNQAESVLAELGKPNSGKKMPESANVFKGDTVPIISEIPGLTPFCKVANGSVGMVIGFLTAPATSVVQAATMPKLISFLTGWLSGAPVNPLAAGADFGNFANMGARLTANDNFASAGGVPLSDSETVAVKDTNNYLDKSDFNQKSIATRLFDLYDPRSVTASLIDSSAQYVNLSGFSKLASNFGSVFNVAISTPGKMLSSFTTAADARQYDYNGAKLVGFSVEDLGDTRFEDPFLNGCKVVGCPDKNIKGVLEDSTKLSKYTDRAEKCFGVKISNDGSNWSLDRNTKTVDMYADNFPENDCRDRSEEWLRIRFWILDTATIEGLDCYFEDTETSTQSCTDSGMQTTGTSSPADQNTGAVSGSTKELAQKILDSNRITLGGNPKSSIEAAAKGDKSPAGVDKCGVQHPPVALNDKLLAFLVDLSSQDSFTVNSLTTGQHSCTSNHYKGSAVDLACDLDTAKADQVGKKYGISHNFENCANDQHWHYSIGGS